MNKFACSIKSYFDAAHRVIGHKGKCAYLHGHRYELEITVSSTQLNELGMVIDFADLKKPIYDWINDNFDHTVILSINDKELGEEISKITKQKIYYLPNNPTAENIAFYLKNTIFNKLINTSNLFIDKVKVFETPNCWIEV